MPSWLVAFCPNLIPGQQPIAFADNFPLAAVGSDRFATGKHVRRVEHSFNMSSEIGLGSGPTGHRPHPSPSSVTCPHTHSVPGKQSILPRHRTWPRHALLGAFPSCCGRCHRGPKPCGTCSRYSPVKTSAVDLD
jgi:hypothetical protein